MEYIYDEYSCLPLPRKLLGHICDIARRKICFSKKRLNRTVTVNEMQFAFMPESVTIDAMFQSRWLQCEYHAKGKKFYMFFGTLRKLLTEYQGKCWNGQ